MAAGEPPDAPIAGVRLAGGRQIVARGVPPDAPIGAIVRFEHEGQTLEGTVSIPPSLLVWCDPSVPRGRFVALVPPAAAPAAATPRPLHLLLAEDDAPDAATVAEMLALAYEELHRLDDEGTYRPRGRGERDRRG